MKAETLSTEMAAYREHVTLIPYLVTGVELRSQHLSRDTRTDRSAVRYSRVKYRIDKMASNSTRRASHAGSWYVASGKNELNVGKRRR